MSQIVTLSVLKNGLTTNHGLMTTKAVAMMIMKILVMLLLAMQTQDKLTNIST